MLNKNKHRTGAAYSHSHVGAKKADVTEAESRLAVAVTGRKGREDRGGWLMNTKTHCAGGMRSDVYNAARQPQLTSCYAFQRELEDRI
jgi:N6-adenosine-specific RNA methylase IME4